MPRSPLTRIRRAFRRRPRPPEERPGAGRGTASGRPRAAAAREAFAAEAAAVEARHEVQSAGTIAALRERYARPVWGTVDTWALLARLGECIDPTDGRLGCVSQLTHTLQVIDAMEDDGVTDPDMWLAALVHDLGKVLLLTGEDPANVVGFNALVGDHAPGIGLDACTFHWNHDEFGYSRLAGHVPEPVARLVRYHSIRLEQCEHVLDDADRAWADRWLRPFRHYDQGSKATHARPRHGLADLRERLGDRLPATLLV